MSRLKIEILDGDHEVEVLVINGGAEASVATLSGAKTTVEVEVVAPQAVVLREAMAVVAEPELPKLQLVDNSAPQAAL